MANRRRRESAIRFVCVFAALLGIASAQDMQMSGDYAAKVVSLSGQVSVLKDSAPWALNPGDKIQMQQVIVTGPDGHAVFQVSDGSTFEVFPDSNVVFRNNPPNWRDLLDVLAGKIKVHIQKWGGQPNFNRIHTPTAVISVRGTTFDVAVDEESSSTEVAVEEGIVDVRHAIHPGVTKTLTSGESVRVLRDEPLAFSRIDKGEVARRLIRALSDAAYIIASRQTHGASGPGGIGPPTPPSGSGTGNKQPTPPPAPPPTPPPGH